MPRTITILEQPAANALRAAYRPIAFLVKVDGVTPPPVVYCDVYISGVYYKTISKTQYAKLNAADSEWRFFVHSACQEVLKKVIGENGASNIISLFGPARRIFCRFRASDYDADGFITPESPAPVQGTGSVAPVPGHGTESAKFYVVNAVIQHHQNQALDTHFGYYKTGTWQANAFPLSHRSSAGNRLSTIDSDYFPIIYTGNLTLVKLKLYFRNKGQVTWFNATNNAVATVPGDDAPVVSFPINYIETVAGADLSVDFTFTPYPTADHIDILYRASGLGGVWNDLSLNVSVSPHTAVIGGGAANIGLYEYRILVYNDAGDVIDSFDIYNGGNVLEKPVVFYVPDGPKNLAALFPAITWANLKEYYLELFDSVNAVVATTPVYQLCECRKNEGVRLHFLNYTGAFDAANFLKPKIITEDGSAEYTSALNYPLKKTDTGFERFNIRSNDTYEMKMKAREEDMAYYQELKSSPKAFLEWNGTEGQSDDYLPVVILNGKFEKLKNDREFEYELVLQCKLANDIGSIRN